MVFKKCFVSHVWIDIHIETLSIANRKKTQQNLKIHTQASFSKALYLSCIRMHHLNIKLYLLFLSGSMFLGLYISSLHYIHTLLLTSQPSCLARVCLICVKKQLNIFVNLTCVAQS